MLKQLNVCPQFSTPRAERGRPKKHKGLTKLVSILLLASRQACLIDINSQGKGYPPIQCWVLPSQAAGTPVQFPSMRLQISLLHILQLAAKSIHAASNSDKQLDKALQQLDKAVCGQSSSQLSRLQHLERLVAHMQATILLQLAEAGTAKARCFERAFQVVAFSISWRFSNGNWIWICNKLYILNLEACYLKKQMWIATLHMNYCRLIRLKKRPL